MPRIWHPLKAHRALQYARENGLPERNYPHRFVGGSCEICGKPESEQQADDCLLSVEHWQRMESFRSRTWS